MLVENKVQIGSGKSVHLDWRAFVLIISRRDAVKEGMKMTWMVFYAGSYLGTITAKTAAAALRKARYEWGSSGEWTDAQLKKFTVRKQNAAHHRSNPTKAQRKTKTRKAATERRVAVALAKYLKQQNPGMKTAGAKVQKLKGGVLKITPIKPARGRR